MALTACEPRFPMKLPYRAWRRFFSVKINTENSVIPLMLRPQAVLLQILKIHILKHTITKQTEQRECLKALHTGVFPKHGWWDGSRQAPGEQAAAG